MICVGIEFRPSNNTIATFIVLQGRYMEINDTCSYKKEHFHADRVETLLTLTIFVYFNIPCWVKEGIRNAGMAFALQTL